MSKHKLLSSAAVAVVNQSEAKLASQLRAIRHLRPEVDGRVAKGEMADEVVRSITWALLDALMVNGANLADAISIVRSEIDAIEQQATNPDLIVGPSSINGAGRRGA